MNQIQQTFHDNNPFVCFPNPLMNEYFQQLNISTMSDIITKLNLTFTVRQVSSLLTLLHLFSFFFLLWCVLLYHQNTPATSMTDSQPSSARNSFVPKCRRTWRAEQQKKKRTSHNKHYSTAAESEMSNLFLFFGSRI